jgi:hypothetical protein
VIAAAARAREALAAWPASREAELLVAEPERREGRGERAHVPSVEEAGAAGRREGGPGGRWRPI